jgi:hypothetical protein
LELGEEKENQYTRKMSEIVPKKPPAKDIAFTKFVALREDKDPRRVVRETSKGAWSTP